MFPALIQKIDEKDENIYVKLAAAAGLARHNDDLDEQTVKSLYEKLSAVEHRVSIRLPEHRHIPTLFEDIEEQWEAHP